MKTILVILFLLPTLSFASPNRVATKVDERLNTRIEKRVGDISFQLEMQFPDLDTASFIAFKECKDSNPDVRPGPALGFKKIYFYAEGLKHPLYYKCKESVNDERRTAKIP